MNLQRLQPDFPGYNYVMEFNKQETKQLLRLFSNNYIIEVIRIENYIKRNEDHIWLVIRIKDHFGKLLFPHDLKMNYERLNNNIAVGVKLSVDDSFFEDYRLNRLLSVDVIAHGNVLELAKYILEEPKTGSWVLRSPNYFKYFYRDID